MIEKYISTLSNIALLISTDFPTKKIVPWSYAPHASYPQLQVGENYSYLTKRGSMILKNGWLMSCFKERHGAIIVRAQNFVNVAACRDVSNRAWCRIFREISCFSPLNISTLFRCCAMLCSWARHLTLKCFTWLRWKWVHDRTAIIMCMIS